MISKAKESTESGRALAEVAVGTSGHCAMSIHLTLEYWPMMDETIRACGECNTDIGIMLDRVWIRRARQEQSNKYGNSIVSNGEDGI